DLVFPHHENEVAQSESATGKPFAKYWMHNGLTRFNTKKVAKSDADPEMQAALVKMTLHNLLAAYPGELIRFFVLGTHYRRPIEYSEAEIEGKRKGLDTFYRLFERVERLCSQSPYTVVPEPPPSRGGGIRSRALMSAGEQYAAAFAQSMDDDFNTAGAIAALFEFAGAINRFIEEEKLETAPGDAPKQDVLSAAAHVIALGRLIGLFLEPPPKRTADDDGIADKAMKVLIHVRQHLRKKKDFESADLIRSLLAEQKITLEDRPDGTVWRAE
ncbi:MAG: DALR domain-containing protein, partial [Planctomycetota bacterium]